MSAELVFACVCLAAACVTLYVIASRALDCVDDWIEAYAEAKRGELDVRREAADTHVSAVLGAARRKAKAIEYAARVSTNKEKSLLQPEPDEQPAPEAVLRLELWMKRKPAWSQEERDDTVGLFEKATGLRPCTESEKSDAAHRLDRKGVPYAAILTGDPA